MNGTAQPNPSRNVTTAQTASRLLVRSASGLMLARPRLRASQSIATIATKPGIQ